MNILLLYNQLRLKHLIKILNNISLGGTIYYKGGLAIEVIITGENYKTRIRLYRRGECFTQNNELVTASSTLEARHQLMEPDVSYFTYFSMPDSNDVIVLYINMIKEIIDQFKLDIFIRTGLI